MSRSLAACLALLLVAAADGPPPSAPLPHASGTPDGPGPRCGGGFTPARGDTLYSIARRCGVAVAEMVDFNELGHPPRLDAGERLELGIEVSITRPHGPPRPERPYGPPPPSAVQPLPHVAPPPPPAREGRWVRVRTRVPVTPVPPPPPPPPPPRREAANIYHFQPGDTLFSLARWARTSLAALREANPGIDPRDIEIGDPINLPRGAVRPEPMRLRERGRPPPAPAAAAAPSPPAALPPRPPAARPAPPPPDEDEADKPKPDDEEGEGPTPGGMDDGAPAPDGM